MLTSMTVLNLGQIRRLQKLSEVNRSDLFISDNHSLNSGSGTDEAQKVSRAHFHSHKKIERRIDRFVKIFAREPSQPPQGSVNPEKFLINTRLRKEKQPKEPFSKKQFRQQAINQASHPTRDYSKNR